MSSDQCGGLIGCSLTGTVRAVVTLKSGIQTSDSEYDSTNGWTIAE